MESIRRELVLGLLHIAGIAIGQPLSIGLLFSLLILSIICFFLSCSPSFMFFSHSLHHFFFPLMLSIIYVLLSFSPSFVFSSHSLHHLFSPLILSILSFLISFSPSFVFSSHALHHLFSPLILSIICFLLSFSPSFLFSSHSLHHFFSPLILSILSFLISFSPSDAVGNRRTYSSHHGGSTDRSKFTVADLSSDDDSIFTTGGGILEMSPDKASSDLLGPEEYHTSMSNVKSKRTTNLDIIMQYEYAMHSFLSNVYYHVGKYIIIIFI